jgi:hypothetical protein
MILAEQPRDPELVIMVSAKYRGTVTIAPTSSCGTMRDTVPACNVQNSISQSFVSAIKPLRFRALAIVRNPISIGPHALRFPRHALSARPNHPRQTARRSVDGASYLKIWKRLL